MINPAALAIMIPVLGQAERERALQEWPAVKRYQQQLWGMHNNFAEGVYPPTIGEKVAEQLALARAQLQAADQHIAQFDAAIRAAAEKAIQEGTFDRATWEQSGLSALPAAVLAAIAVVAIAIPVGMWLVYRATPQYQAKAQAYLEAARALIAGGGAGQVLNNAGNSGGWQLPAIAGGLGLVAVALVVLFMLSRRGGRS